MFTCIKIYKLAGDSGANSRSNPDCALQQLFPSYPASSAYVTAVGGTEVSTNKISAQSCYVFLFLLVCV